MLDALAAEEVDSANVEEGNPNACETQWMQTQNSNALTSSFVRQREYEFFPPTVHLEFKFLPQI